MATVAAKGSGTLSKIQSLLEDKTEYSVEQKRKKTSYTIQTAFQNVKQMEFKQFTKRHIPLCKADVNQQTLQ